MRHLVGSVEFCDFVGFGTGVVDFLYGKTLVNECSSKSSRACPSSGLSSTKSSNSSLEHETCFLETQFLLLSKE
jgi:hypothetical protein